MRELSKTGILELKALNEMVKDEGLETGHADRFLRVGEWGMAFIEIHASIQSSSMNKGKYYETLIRLDTELSKYEYLRKHFGFPLLDNGKA